MFDNSVIKKQFSTVITTLVRLILKLVILNIKSTYKVFVINIQAKIS